MLVDQKSIYQTITEKDYIAMSGPEWPDYQSFSQGCQIEKFVADEIDQMLSSVNAKKNQLTNFCVLPFYGREYPGNTHCCLLPKKYDIDKIRADMLSNRRASECNKCGHLEDSGNLSDRQIKNRTLDFTTATDLLYLYDNAVAGNYQTTHYKISASNFCNATCVTCDAGASTAWGDLLKVNEKGTKSLQLLKIDSQRISLDYKSAKFIGFLGGESTMIKTHWDILEKLIEYDNYECMISFTTNGSFKLTARQKQLLTQFKNVNFNFSIDGTEKVFEYLRFPLDWQQTLENISWAKKQNFIISSTYTISNLNIFYHEKNIKWFEDNEIKLLENPVYYPIWFSPRALGHRVKEQILNQTDNDLIRSFLSHHTESDEKNYQEFLKQIKHQDTMKRISLQDYLPDFADIIDYQ